ncbi:hypothetical protein C8R44DRAFT_850429 [Mycena epipterygia]|nr:hypothetical protein C8R44DRAFT_850429 [Mycena epipterygia]
MPWPSVIILLCFFASVSGQLFQAFCASISLDVVKIQHTSPPVASGISFKSLGFLCVCLSCTTSSSPFSFGIFSWGRHPRISSEPKPSSTSSLRLSMVQRNDAATTLPNKACSDISGHLWGRSSIPGYCTALVLAVKRDRSPVVVLAAHMPKILLGVHLFPLYLLCHLAAASSIIKVDHPKINDATVEALLSVPPAGPQDYARLSHFPLPRHLAAAAMLQKCRVRIVLEEPCHATIQEVAEAVEGSSTTSAATFSFGFGILLAGDRGCGEVVLGMGTVSSKDKTRQSSEVPIAVTNTLLMFGVWVRVHLASARVANERVLIPQLPDVSFQPRVDLGQTRTIPRRAG